MPLTHIYIPLCFYFISDHQAGTENRVGIYIPLCFYFIPEQLPDAKQPTEFTFHYASTLSLSSASSPFPYPDLHSTMLLLYPISEAGEILLLECIYIPLCFYFILQRSCQQCRGLPFTFHYASTLSSLEKRLMKLYIAFTFHYASTLSERT